MFYVRLKGGLGNQMFQYAFGQALKARTGKEVVYDTAFIEHLLNQKNTEFAKRDIALDIFPHINANEIQSLSKDRTLKYYTKFAKIVRKIKEKLDPHFISQKRYQYDDYSPKVKDGVYFDGDWQSYKYFDSIKNDILAKFAFKSSANYGVTDEAAKLFEEKICDPGIQSVCIHVRRGDMAKDPRANAHHGTTSIEYYTHAIKTILEKNTEPSISFIFFVFSDDIEWCKHVFSTTLFTQNELAENPKLTHIQFEFFNDTWAGTKAANQLRIMTMCDHFIIGNSTYSWWAAYLGEQSVSTIPKKIKSIIISPKHFFRAPGYDTTDLIPPHWIQLNTPLD